MAQPIVPWIGGKRRLADTLLGRFPAHTCYVELFAGGAALYFLRPPAECEVINDVNGDLVNLYRVVQRHLEEFVRQFKWALSSREVFKWQQNADPAGLTDIQRAARFYYLQHNAFGGRVDGQSWGTATTAPPINLLRIEESLSAAHLRLSGAYIERLDWSACIDRYDRPHTLFYADPPYWQTEGYGVPFDWPQYEALAKRLATLKGKAIVSLNDHPDVRRAFAQYQMETLEIEYTVGGGAARAPRRELIIYSWDRDAEPAGLFWALRYAQFLFAVQKKPDAPFIATGAVTFLAAHHSRGAPAGRCSRGLSGFGSGLRGGGFRGASLGPDPAPEGGRKFVLGP